MLLDIGCGPNKKAGYVGMDHYNFDGVDIVHDLRHFPWPLEDGSVQLVYAQQILEHFNGWELIGIIEEVWRILQPGGQFVVQVSTKGSPNCGKDFTHQKTDWDEFSFDMWKKEDGEYIIERGPLYGIKGEFRLEQTMVDDNMDRTYVLTAVKT